jgi:hypothetical protein
MIKRYPNGISIETNAGIDQLTIDCGKYELLTNLSDGQFAYSLIFTHKKTGKQTATHATFFTSIQYWKNNGVVYDPVSLTFEWRSQWGSQHIVKWVAPDSLPSMIDALKRMFKIRL